MPEPRRDGRDRPRRPHLPIATGERLFTKWGFREVLEKRAATILQPDLCHAGGITEVPPDRRDGRGVLRRHRPAQPARARSRWPPASSSPRRSRTSSARSRSASARATSRRRSSCAERLPATLPTGPGPRHRARRGRPGRQDRPRLEEPRELRRGRRLGHRLVAARPPEVRPSAPPAPASSTPAPSGAGSGRPGPSPAARRAGRPGARRSRPAPARSPGRSPSRRPRTGCRAPAGMCSFQRSRRGSNSRWLAWPTVCSTRCPLARLQNGQHQAKLSTCSGPCRPGSDGTAGSLPCV